MIGPSATPVGTLHDVTKRSENAFGEKYPSSTLKYFPSEGATKQSKTPSKGKQK